MARILLIAPTCDGEDIGEAWVAFQWAKRLAPRHDVTLLTYHKRGRTPVAQQLDGLRIVEWREPWGLARFERLNSLMKPAYLPFHFRARRWIKAALRRGEVFDVAHQPLPVAMRYPSPAADLGIPLVMGPVGGGLPDPPAFEADEESTPWYVRLRKLDGFRMRHDPILRRTYASAACVVGIAPYVKGNLENVAARRFEVMSETGLDSLPVLDGRTAEAGDVVRLLFVGRLVRTKAVRDVIQAMDQLSDLPVHLDVVGRGPEHEICESLVADLGLTHRVTLHGAVPRSTVDTFYESSDIFVFPSYREPGGNVVFEAMGYGLPLVVSDRGGPASAVDDSCALRVGVTEQASFVGAIASAVRTLVLDRNLRLSMGIAARERAGRTALWDSKVQLMEQIYADVSSRP